MSFLTEYFDEFRAKPINKRSPCCPEDRYTVLEGKWMDPKKGKQDREMSDEEIQKFIKVTMRSLRGESTYFTAYCAHLDQSFKTREPVPPKHKRCPFKSAGPKPTVAEDEAHSLGETLALKDTEVMKMAAALYNMDLNEPTLKPISTHARVMSYCRPCLYHTGISEYQNSISRLAYELVRDDRIPRYQAANGGRAKWGYPPEEPRQPELDGIPLDGERLY